MADVTAVGTPARAENEVFWVIFNILCWLIQAAFVVGEPLCDLEPLLSPNNGTCDFLIKIKWFMANLETTS